MYKTINLDETFYRISKSQIIKLNSKREFLYSILLEYNKYFGNITDATRTYPGWQITGNDIVVISNTFNRFFYDYNPVYEFRDIEYFDGYGRRINPKDYILEAIKTIKLQENHPSMYYVRGRRVQHQYRYRMDPVPYTGKIKGGCSGAKKFRGVKRIYQQASDPEYGKYIRKKALPMGPFMTWDFDAYEETRLHESWKKQKKRKQWM